jgi:N-acyl-D-aspartate/D-glutamate deacylase
VVRLKNDHSVFTGTLDKSEYLLSGAIDTHLHSDEVIPRSNRLTERSLPGATTRIKGVWRVGIHHVRNDEDWD